MSLENTSTISSIHDENETDKWVEYAKSTKEYCDILHKRKCNSVCFYTKNFNDSLVCILCGVNSGKHLFHPFEYCDTCGMDRRFAKTSIKLGKYDNSYLEYIKLLENELLSVKDKIIAFMMGNNDKLGKKSLVNTINEDIILKNIVQYTLSIKSDDFCLLNYYYNERLECSEDKIYWKEKIKNLTINNSLIREISY